LPCLSTGEVGRTQPSTATTEDGPASIANCRVDSAARSIEPRRGRPLARCHRARPCVPAVADALHQLSSRLCSNLTGRSSSKTSTWRHDEITEGRFATTTAATHETGAGPRRFNRSILDVAPAELRPADHLQAQLVRGVNSIVADRFFHPRRCVRPVEQ